MITGLKKTDLLLLDALRCALHGSAVEWTEPVSDEDWIGFICLARQHRIFPMLAEAVFTSPAVACSEKRLRMIKNEAKKLTLYQAQRTGDFLLLYKALAERGLRPIITKGIMCRRIYPHPDQRISVDEDMLIEKTQGMAYHNAMLEFGFEPVEPEADPENVYEAAYNDDEKHLYIEIHKMFFAPDSDAYADCNAPLEGASDRSVEVDIDGITLRTFAPTDHLLYLILHAFKHFLHGGVGIRQVSDICMFASHYENESDFKHIRSACDDLSITRFAAAIFRIGEKHLGFEMPPAFADIDVDPEPLLLDMLSGGLYGVEDINRAHSSTMTLEAVASHKKGRRSRGALHSVFLPRRELEGRYPYLKKYGWLLPAAWVQRGWRYLTDRNSGLVSPAESLRIGRERVELLRKYGIID